MPFFSTRAAAHTQYILLALEIGQVSRALSLDGANGLQS
jgi:hypothetical protein